MYVTSMYNFTLRQFFNEKDVLSPYHLKPFNLITPLPYIAIGRRQTCHSTQLRTAPL